MKPKNLASAIATILATCGTSAVMAESISLYDYDQATSAYEDAYINGQFNLDSGNQDQTSYDMDLSLDYEKVFSSPDSNTKLDFIGETSRSRGPNAGDDSVSYYQAEGSATYDNYFTPGSKGAFWYGKGELGLRKGQEDPFTKVTAGIGYGRVVNVTPMAKAIRLVEALRERDIIKAEPSKATYQAVAGIIDREDEYKSKYGLADYEQMWIQDIEQAMGESLGARGVIKVYDVLSNERISTRKHGWLVRAGAGAVITDYDGEDGKPALEVGAEYHLPLSNKTQFSDEAILTAILDDGDNSYRVSNTMTLTHEISDRIDWENAWLLDYENNENANDVLTNALSSGFRYYISNALSFTITGKLTDVEDDIDGNGNDEIDKSLLLALSYRLK